VTAQVISTQYPRKVTGSITQRQLGAEENTECCVECALFVIMREKEIIKWKKKKRKEKKKKK
jgi:NAD-dependent dihydropyrimidine dehydrogenase PreA subunit